jgi:hypothetical protein
LRFATGRQFAREKMKETAGHAATLAAALPVTRDLLSRFRRYGLQKIRRAAMASSISS